MQGQCHQCGPQELLPRPVRVYCHTVAALGWPVQVERPHACANCGREIRMETSYHLGQASRALAAQTRGDAGQGKVEHMRAMISMRHTAGRFTTVQYPAVCLTGTRQVSPSGEGTIQDGTVVDQYGEPELMASFAKHYLSAYRAVMPTGRPPMSVVEMMPALHLLVMSAELVMKADLIRSENDPGQHHSLENLYSALDEPHRQEADERFARCEPNARLRSVGEATQAVLDVLTVYDLSYGGASKVYMDTRYYAEPTIRFKESTGLQGASLLKSNTPYPIFLPHVVEALIETFRFFDGAARLERFGGTVAFGARTAVDNNHGDWGLVPGSLGLVAVQVLQGAWMDARHNELPEFQRWKQSRPPGFSTSWMYGGSTLLFYRADKSTPPDSARNIDGLTCRIWRDDSLGMHSRDLYRLADAFDSGRISDTLRV